MDDCHLMFRGAEHERKEQVANILVDSFRGFHLSTIAADAQPSINETVLLTFYGTLQVENCFSFPFLSFLLFFFSSILSLKALLNILSLLNANLSVGWGIVERKIYVQISSSIRFDFT